MKYCLFEVYYAQIAEQLTQGDTFSCQYKYVLIAMETENSFNYFFVISENAK
jgi:hypothetical protein